MLEPVWQQCKKHHIKYGATVCPMCLEDSARPIPASPVGAGSTGAPDDQPTPKDRPPMGSCLICGRLEVFAAWHSTYHVGVCTRCRDAGHLAGGLLHPPAPLAQPTPEKTP
jgi:hypothetical protein